MKDLIYLAGPLFTPGERWFNSRLAATITEHARRAGKDLEVYLPQEEAEGSTVSVFQRNRHALDRAKVVVAVLDGPDVDSGTAWEVGYAFAKGIPVVGVRFDYRQSGEDGSVNLMIRHSLTGRLIRANGQETEAVWHQVVKKVLELL